MFNQPENQSRPAASTAPAASSAPANRPAAEVYVMPDKFQTAKGREPSNKALVIALLFLLLVVVATGIYFFYDLWQKNNQAAEISNTNEAVNLNSNETLNTNSQNANVNATEETAANTNAAETEEKVAAETLTVTTDTDRDGLTDVEEALFGSSATKPDTDNDGYLDGDEVVAGFDPIKAGSSAAVKLAAADKMKVFYTDFAEDNFSFLTFKDWSLSTIATLKEARLTAADTGEIIKITVLANSDGLSATNWYLKNHPEAELSQLRQIKAGELAGVFSPDGLRAYLTNPERNKFYVFEYNVMDEKGEFRYPTVFTLMIKSFTLVALNELPGAGGNASTTPTL